MTGCKPQTPHLKGKGNPDKRCKMFALYSSLLCTLYIHRTSNSISGTTFFSHILQEPCDDLVEITGTQFLSFLDEAYTHV